jgi:hypothetical protein
MCIGNNGNHTPGGLITMTTFSLANIADMTASILVDAPYDIDDSDLASNFVQSVAQGLSTNATLSAIVTMVRTVDSSDETMMTFVSMVGTAVDDILDGE